MASENSLNLQKWRQKCYCYPH